MRIRIINLLSNIDKGRIVSILLVIMVYLITQKYFQGLLPSTNGMISFFRNTGLVGFLLFLALSLLRGLLLFPPNFTMALMCGVLYGPYLGIPAALLGSLLCALFEFNLARLLGDRLIRRFFGKPILLPDILLNARFVFWLRIMMTVPYDAANYALGLTAISLREYVVGTLVGLIPNIVLLTLFGNSLNELTLGNVLPFSALTLIGLVMIFRDFRKDRCVARES